ncbi:MAG TPA: hypothetical protein VHQ22_15915 [Terriglobales bacterium]|jgi:hypothetical protein|nr:hypothetical protein [Terriglobales bacterium]
MSFTTVGILALVLQAALACTIFLRRLSVRFRFFLIYTLYSIGSIAVSLWARQNTQALFVSYALSEILYGALGLLAMREAFQDALAAYNMRYPWTRWIPPLVVLALVGAALFGCFYHPRIRGNVFNACLLGAMRSYNWVVRSVELFVFVLFISLKPLYRWRRYNQGVILGFGVYSFISLLSYSLRTFFVVKVFATWYRYLSPGAYFGAAAFWLVAFLWPENRLEQQPPDERQIQKVQTALEESLDALEKPRHKRP